MAKRIVDEEMRFSLIINGDSAQKELYQVENQTRKLTATNKNLRAERDKLRSQGKQNTAAYKKLSASIKENNATISKNKARMKALQEQIGVTGLTMAQLQKRASTLRLQLRNMVPGSAEYKRLQADLTATNSRIKSLATQANAAKFSLGGLANGFNRYAALGAAVIATGTGIALSMSKLIDFQGELSDAQSNVRKTTGLTNDEVQELTKNLGQIDTRSSRMELLALSEEAGRLGITGVENIQGFVETANKLKVALGDELSDEAIREVGKMANIFNVGEQTGRNFEESMESLGSSINHVSASGANTADFLVDFMKRTAGVAGVADIQADKIIGIAAAFDELGQSQETSATALNKTLLSMGKDVEKFAAAANISAKELSETLEKDANEALFMFLEGVGRGNPSLETMAKRLDGIELGGTRGTQSMAALAGNLDLVRKRQEDANGALLANTSLMDEYNIKNENTAALLAKIKRRIMGVFASENVTNGIANLIEWFAKFIGATEDADGSVTSFRNALVFTLKILAVLVVGIFSYNTAIAISAAVTGTAHKQTLLYNIALKTKNIITGAATALTRSYAITKAFLTGKIKLATAAQKLFNIAVRNNPIGIIIALLAAATTAYIAFSKSTSEAAKRERMLDDVRTQAAKSIAKEKNELENLLKIAEDEKSSKEDREKAIQKLNKISPEYLGNLDSENIKTKEGIRLVEDYVSALDKKALAQAAENKQIELQQKLIEVQMKTTDEYKSTLEEFGDNTVGKIFDKIFGETKELNIRSREDLESYLSESDFSDDLAETIRKTYDNIFEAKDKEISQIEKDIKSLNQFMNKNIVLDIDNDDDDDDDGGGSGDDRTKFKLENLLQEREALARLRKENADLEANQIADAFDRELLLLQNNHKEKLRRLKTQKIAEAEMAKTQGLLDKAVLADNKEAIDNYSQVLEIWADKNKEIDNQILLEKQVHQRDLANLVQDGIEMEIQLLEDAYIVQQKKEEEKRIAELAAVADSETKTQKLKEQYRKEDLQRERDHVQAIKDELKRIWDSGQFEDFDLDLLTEEQKNQIVTRLQELGLEISQINLLLAQMQNGGKEGDALADLGLGGNVDILGFTPEQWEQMFDNFSNLENVLESVVMIAAAASNAFAMYSDMRSKKENERMRQMEQNNDEEKRRLKQRLDAGYINERQYNDAILRMDEKVDERKAEIAKKQAERERKAALFAIAVDTARALISVWANPGFPFAIPLSALIAGTAAMQIASVKSAPGFEEGFYGDKFPVKREQDGKMFNAGFGGESRSGIVNEPTMFLAGEQGKTAPEMIISGGDYAKLTPDLKQTLNRELSTVRGFQDGFYKDDSSGGMSEQMELLLMQNTTTLTRLNKIIDNGILAKVIANESNARELEEALEKYRKRKESSKL